MATNQEYLDRLKVVECPDSTYRPDLSPLIFQRAAGSTVWDAEGKDYTDLCMGFGVQALGHAHPELQKILADAPLVHGMGDVYPSAAKIELLEKLIEVLPDRFEQAGLALSGGQAVEYALKTVMLATTATGLITFEEGYHGLDLGVLPTSSRSDFRQPFAGWSDANNVIRLPYGCPLDTVEAAITKLKNSAAGFAGVLAEPLQGRGGIVSPPDGWLSALAEATHHHHGLLILDEVFTGLGRLGQMTAAATVPADLICLGKPLGGGLPLSACVGTHSVMSVWPQSRGEALHTGTFFGHPLSCHLGKRFLELLEQDNLLPRVDSLGDKVLSYLRENLRVGEVRGRGLMLGIAFDQPGMGARLMDQLRENRIIALAGGAQGEVLTLSPAFTVPEHQLRQSLAIIVDLCNKNRA